MIKDISANVVTSDQLYAILWLLNRDDLREIARLHEIPQGKTKSELVDNLLHERRKFGNRVITVGI